MIERFFMFLGSVVSTIPISLGSKKDKLPPKEICSNIPFWDAQIEETPKSANGIEIQRSCQSLVFKNARFNSFVSIETLTYRNLSNFTRVFHGKTCGFCPYVRILIDRYCHEFSKKTIFSYFISP